MNYITIEFQLFAEGLNTNVTTQESLSAEMKTFYDMTLIDEASPKLVHEQFGQKRPIPQGKGKSVEFRKFSALPKALTPITEGVTPAGGSLEVTTVTAEVEQYGYYITQSDMLELTAIDNTIVQATKLLGQQAGITLDTIVRNIINAGTNVAYAPKIANGAETAVEHRYDLDETCNISVKLVEKEAANMRAHNVPSIDGFYVMIVHPYVVNDLRNDERWIDAHKYTNADTIYNGEAGRIGGVRFVESSEAKIFKGGKIAGTRDYLTVSSVSGTSITIKESLTSAEQAMFDGTKPTPIIIGGKPAEVLIATSATQLGLMASVSGIQANDKIYLAGGGKDNRAVFSCLLLGADAYGVTEISGGGLQTIVKQKGSGGTSDPLDQRSTIGWKSTRTAEILLPQYIRRIEVCAKDFNPDSEN